jgi:hypothetical protein
VDEVAQTFPLISHSVFKLKICKTTANFSIVPSNLDIAMLNEFMTFSNFLSRYGQNPAGRRVKLIATKWLLGVFVFDSIVNICCGMLDKTRGMDDEVLTSHRHQHSVQ